MQTNENKKTVRNFALSSQRKKKNVSAINIHYALSTSYNFCLWIKF